MKIDRKQALSLIKNSQGRFFGVRFKKKNGEQREMNARLGVKKGVTGKGLKYNPADYDLLTAYDRQKEQYRMINLATISRLTLDKQTYEVEDN